MKAVIIDTPGEVSKLTAISLSRLVQKFYANEENIRLYEENVNRQNNEQKKPSPQAEEGAV